MDLKTGNLLWPALCDCATSFPQVQNDLTCDVAVVGAGVSGAMVAATLSAEGLDVVAVDKREPAEGSTAASSALVLYEIDIPLIDLGRMLGTDHARRAYEASRRAIDDLEGIINRFG